MRKHSLSLAIVALVTVPLMVAAVSCTSAMGDTVTLTGCLQLGDEAGTFELDPVTESSEEIDARALELVPADDLDLSAHVGHEVRVTGEKMDAEGAHEEGYEEEGYAGETGAEATGAGRTAAHEGQELHVKVTELEHISATCTG